MRNEYYIIYNKLFYDYLFDDERGYRRQYRFSNYTAEVNDLVQDVGYTILNYGIEYKGSRELRPDAKYFLLINFVEMIINPVLSHIRYIDENFSIQELKHEVLRDLRFILKLCFEGSTAKKQEYYISGHKIVSLINQNWEELSTTSFRIWG